MLVKKKKDSLYLLEVIYFMYMQNVAIRICGKMKTLFSQSPN
jgi:hypothetical protein